MNAPAKYRKRPVVIEAMQWTGDNAEQIIRWAGTVNVRSSSSRPETLRVSTLEGDLFAGIGDWIIRGVVGEFHPVRADIFEQTYEPVGDDQ